MNKKGIMFLLNTIHFERYDKDFEPYINTINELATKYDYRSVVDNLLRFMVESNDGEYINKENKFNRYMKYCKFDSKKTEERYMEIERKEIQEIQEAEIKFYGRVNKPAPRVEMSDFMKNHLKQLPEEYQKYTTMYMLEKSKEYNISISLICEKKGLVPSWVIWELGD